MATSSFLRSKAAQRAQLALLNQQLVEHLIYVYLELKKFVGKDLHSLSGYLQQAISQTGKAGFQSAIEDGMMQLLGEKA